jgi:hypothetical protein
VKAEICSHQSELIAASGQQKPIRVVVGGTGQRQGNFIEVIQWIATGFESRRPASKLEIERNGWRRTTEHGLAQDLGNCDAFRRFKTNTPGRCSGKDPFVDTKD